MAAHKLNWSCSEIVEKLGNCRVEGQQVRGYSYAYDGNYLQATIDDTARGQRKKVVGGVAYTEFMH